MVAAAAPTAVGMAFMVLNYVSGAFVVSAVKK